MVGVFESRQQSVQVGVVQLLWQACVTVCWSWGSRGYRSNNVGSMCEAKYCKVGSGFIAACTVLSERQGGAQHCASQPPNV